MGRSSEVLHRLRWLPSVLKRPHYCEVRELGAIQVVPNIGEFEERQGLLDRWSCHVSRRLPDLLMGAETDQDKFKSHNLRHRFQEGYLLHCPGHTQRRYDLWSVQLVDQLP